MENKQKTLSKRMSFFSKDPLPCPFCKTPVFKEEMLTGRGRLFAENISRELRREYKPIEGLGYISPMIYTLITCPECLISLFPRDFSSDYSPEIIKSVQLKKEQRYKLLYDVFKEKLDFSLPKNLKLGAASYFLALSTYPSLGSKYSSSLKCSISSIRFYWLLGDLAKSDAQNSTYYQKLKEKMAPRIAKYLEMTEEKIYKKEESFSFFGPDTDRDYGADGFFYLKNLFLFHTLPKENPIIMEKNLLKIKSSLSKMFGFGKSSKEKPGPILMIVRELYNEVNEEYEILSTEPKPLLD